MYFPKLKPMRFVYLFVCIRKESVTRVHLILQTKRWMPELSPKMSDKTFSLSFSIYVCSKVDVSFKIRRTPSRFLLCSCDDSSVNDHRDSKAEE